MAPVKKCLSLQRLLISKYDIAIVAKNSFAVLKLFLGKQGFHFFSEIMELTPC